MKRKGLVTKGLKKSHCHFRTIYIHSIHLINNHVNLSLRLWEHIFPFFLHIFTALAEKRKKKTSLQSSMLHYCAITCQLSKHSKSTLIILAEKIVWRLNKSEWKYTHLLLHTIQTCLRFISGQGADSDLFS